MIEWKTKPNSGGQYYFPKEVREEIGSETILICGVKVAVIYDSRLSVQQLRRSIEILLEERSMKEGSR